MYTCVCCNMTYSSQHGLSRHISQHGLNKKEYYDKFLKVLGEGNCQVCGEETTFRGQSYLKYCQKECYNSSEETSEKRRVAVAGKKQSHETVRKRIENTDQAKKEEKRKNTMINLYGQTNIMSAGKTEEEIKEIHDKISSSHRGRKHTKEHHEKIIENKRKNGTLTHQENSRIAMQIAQRRINDSDDPPDRTPNIVTSQINGRGHITGNFEGLSYRSQYELRFLEICKEHNIKVESAQNKEFRVKYLDESGNRRVYYPDFYLPEYDIIIEIKPLQMFEHHNNQEKFDAISRLNVVQNFQILTEEELYNETNLWVKELEYLRT